MLCRHSGKLSDLPVEVRKKGRTRAGYLWINTHWPAAICLGIYVYKPAEVLFLAFLLMFTFWFLVDLLFGLEIVREILYAEDLRRSCLKLVFISVFVVIIALSCFLACVDYKKKGTANFRLVDGVQALMHELNSPTKLEEYYTQGEECGFGIGVYYGKQLPLLIKLCSAYLIGCLIVCLPIGYTLFRRP